MKKSNPVRCHCNRIAIHCGYCSEECARARWEANAETYVILKPVDKRRKMLR